MSFSICSYRTGEIEHAISSLISPPHPNRWEVPPVSRENKARSNRILVHTPPQSLLSLSLSLSLVFSSSPNLFLVIHPPPFPRGRTGARKKPRGGPRSGTPEGGFVLAHSRAHFFFFLVVIHIYEGCRCLAFRGRHGRVW